MADGTAPIETPVERLKRREAELRGEALAIRDALIGDLAAMAGRCAETASLESLPPGVRNGLAQLGQKIEADVQNLLSIQIRTAE